MLGSSAFFSTIFSQFWQLMSEAILASFDILSKTRQPALAKANVRATANSRLTL